MISAAVAAACKKSVTSSTISRAVYCASASLDPQCSFNRGQFLGIHSSSAHHYLEALSGSPFVSRENSRSFLSMGRKKAGSKVAQKSATVTASHNSKNAKVTAEETNPLRANPTLAQPYAVNGSASPVSAAATPKEDSLKVSPTSASNGSLTAESNRVTSIPANNGSVAKEAAATTNGSIAVGSKTASFKKAAQPLSPRPAPALTLSPFALLRSFLLFIVTSILSQLAVLWEKPLKVVGGAGPLNEYILERLPLLRTPYRPFVYLPLIHGHFETIFGALYRSCPQVTFRRTCLPMPDGGVVALDWPMRCEELGGEVEEPPAGAPWLILLPGLTGGSDDDYIRYMLIAARQRGWGVVVFNSRGCANSPVTTPQFYSASFTEDIRHVVRHVSSLFPSSRLYACGWSLGANILVNYVAEEGENVKLSGAISLANPLDLILGDRNFAKGFNQIYTRKLAKSINNFFMKHQGVFNNLEGVGDYDLELARKAQTIRDFDEGLTRVSFGFPSVDEYYSVSSSCKRIKDVRTPLLCVQALDDPISPAEGIPEPCFEKNPQTLLVVTPYGGHIGWIAGKEAPFGRPWTDELVMEYLIAVEERCEGEGRRGEDAGNVGDGVGAGQVAAAVGGSK